QPMVSHVPEVVLPPPEFNMGQPPPTLIQPASNVSAQRPPYQFAPQQPTPAPSQHSQAAAPMQYFQPTQYSQPLQYSPSTTYSQSTQYAGPMQYSQPSATYDGPTLQNSHAQPMSQSQPSSFTGFLDDRYDESASGPYQNWSP